MSAARMPYIFFVYNESMRCAVHGSKHIKAASNLNNICNILMVVHPYTYAPK